MFFRELVLALRRNFWLNFLSGLLIFFSLILIFVLTFYSHTNRITSGYVGEEVTEGFQMKAITQDMMRRAEGDLIEGLQNFYDEMSRSEVFDTFIYSHQFLELQEESFKAESLSLRYRWEVDWMDPTLVSAMIVNSAYLEAFPLSLQEGRAFSESDVQGYRGIYPVVAGYGFMRYYQLGEIMEGELFNRDFQFEIIGFLSQNHQGPDFHWYETFDEFLILPFIDFRNTSGQEIERNFITDYYINLVHPWIRMEDTRLALDYAINEVESISNYTGVPMMFIDANRTLIRNTLTRNVIAMHLDALTSFLIFICVLISMVFYYFAKVKYLRKKDIYRTLSLLGIPKGKQIALILLENAAFIFPFIFLSLYYLIFGSELIVLWSLVSHYSRWGVISTVLFNTWEWYLPDTHLIWNVLLYGFLFFIIQNIYPVWKITRVYKGGEADD